MCCSVCDVSQYYIYYIYKNVTHFCISVPIRESMNSFDCKEKLFTSVFYICYFFGWFFFYFILLFASTLVFLFLLKVDVLHMNTILIFTHLTRLLYNSSHSSSYMLPRFHHLIFVFSTIPRIYLILLPYHRYSRNCGSFCTSIKILFFQNMAKNFNHFYRKVNKPLFSFGKISSLFFFHWRNFN